ncbi:MAG: rhomboid family intramembrane serine protease [Anaerolineae bacterium]
MFRKSPQPAPPRWDTPSGAVPPALHALPVIPEGANYIYHRVPMVPYATLILVAINIGVYLLQLAVPTISVWGSTSRDAILNTGGLYRLLTASFLHINEVHLLSNMYALLVLGIMFERYFGHRRLLVIYLLSGIGGGILSASLHPSYTLSLGASGAIFGLAIAFILCYQRHSEVLMAQRRFFLYWTLLAMFYAFLNGMNPDSNIDNWAHLGGAITGGVIASRTARFYDFHFAAERLRPDALIEYFPKRVRWIGYGTAIALSILMITVVVTLSPIQMHVSGVNLSIPGEWVPITEDIEPFLALCNSSDDQVAVVCTDAILMSLDAVVDVIVQTPPEDMTFDLHSADTQYAGRMLLQEGLLPISREEYAINGREGIRYLYSRGDQQLSVVLLVDNRRLVLFMFLFLRGDYERYRDAVDHFLLYTRFDPPSQ